MDVGLCVTVATLMLMSALGPCEAVVEALQTAAPPLKEMVSLFNKLVVIVKASKLEVVPKGLKTISN